MSPVMSARILGRGGRTRSLWPRIPFIVPAKRNPSKSSEHAQLRRVCWLTVLHPWVPEQHLHPLPQDSPSDRARPQGLQAGRCLPGGRIPGGIFFPGIWAATAEALTSLCVSLRNINGSLTSGNAFGPSETVSELTDRAKGTDVPLTSGPAHTTAGFALRERSGCLRASCFSRRPLLIVKLCVMRSTPVPYCIFR